MVRRSRRLPRQRELHGGVIPIVVRDSRLSKCTQLRKECGDFTERADGSRRFLARAAVQQEAVPAARRACSIFDGELNTCGKRVDRNEEQSDDAPAATTRSRLRGEERAACRLFLIRLSLADSSRTKICAGKAKTNCQLKTVIGRPTERPSMNRSSRRHILHLIVTAVALLAACQLAGLESASRTDSAILLVVLFALHVPELSRSVWLYLTPADLARPRMLGRHCIFQEIIWSTRSVPLLLLLACTHGTLWSFPEIGISPRIPPAVCVAIGLVVSVAFNACLSRPVNRSACTVQRPDLKRTIATLRMHLPRGTLAQLASGFKCVYSSPLFEELIYRGFFVFYLSHVTSSVLLAVFVGWMLCVVLHLYQGTRRILPVTIFYCVATGLLFSPAGLLSAIGFHSGCNLEYVLRLRDMAQRHLLRPRPRQDQHADVALSYGRKLQVAVGLLVITVLLEWVPFHGPDGFAPVSS